MKFYDEFRKTGLPLNTIESEIEFMTRFIQQEHKGYDYSEDKQKLTALEKLAQEMKEGVV